MGKYFSDTEESTGTLGPLGCKGLPGLYANDIVGEGCWAVSGAPVIIDDTYMSIMAGFEMTNFNFRIDGTQPCCPNQYALPGPMG